MTHPNYEQDRAEAQAVYDRLMMETNFIVAHARAPLPPQKPTKPLSFWRRALEGFVRGRTGGAG